MNLSPDLRSRTGLMCGLVLAAAVSLSGANPEWQPADWPVLKRYDADHLLRIALPLGGIGTGTVSLGGRGELRDWEIMNRPAKGFSTVVPGNDAPFFALQVTPESGPPLARALLGPLDPTEYNHAEGRPANHHGLPRFAHAAFAAAYPFGEVELTDPGLPVRVRVRGFNPLIPGNADDSGLPVAVLTYEVTNTTGRPLRVSVCGSLRNFIGCDGSRLARDWKGDWVPAGAKGNRNTWREEPGLRGIFLDSAGVDPQDEAWGSIALATAAAEGVTHRTSSRANEWSNSLLDFWDDFAAGGELAEKAKPADEDPMASLAIRRTIAPGATVPFTFFLTWHFPNRRAWSPFRFESGGEIIGNYYTTRQADAWAAACAIVPRLTELERQTLAFVRAVLATDCPDVVKEAALFNLSTLRSQTVFRLPSGQLCGWEGVMDTAGSCYGSCTHVWNYEGATAHLFGGLARTMREVEFGPALNAEGRLANRVMLPFGKFTGGEHPAADGQMGCIIKFYREWQLGGDRDFLARHWPAVRSALAYAWRPGGWDADQDGVMEGAQANTMDVEYFGPNPQMGFWYLAALRAGGRMADAMGDAAFAAHCRDLADQGSAWMDAHLFNGEYYEHIVTDPKTHTFTDWSRRPAEEFPRFQLGRGCLVDQLVGQMMADLCGLGALASEDHLRSALRSILRYNWRDQFRDHFNNMRSFVFADESGLLMASWPRGRLAVPFPYFAEVMTGFEYTAATNLIQAGLREDAVRVIAAVRDRHDGRKRNPFSEPECGHHYARAMASWNTLLAWTGFRFSAVDRTLGFADRPGTWFWSTGYAWGTCRVDADTATLAVLSGELPAATLTIGRRSAAIPPGRVSAGQALTLPLRARD